MNPAVSVIIPVYNGEKTIGRCLDSLFAQTLQQLEIIVVDDGSTDQTLPLLKRYQNSRLLVLHQENSGQGCARNAGLMAAHAPYVGFVDADDTVDPHMYEAMLYRARQTGADVVQCNLLDIEADGRADIQLPVWEAVVDRVDPHTYFGDYMLTNRHSYEVCNKLFLRSFLKTCGLRFYPNHLVYAEDLLFNMQLAGKRPCIAFMKEAYYHYYQHEDSHARQYTAEKIEQLYHLFETFEYNEVDPKIVRNASQIAVLVLMQNIARFLECTSDMSAASMLLRRRALRRYLWYAVLEMKKLRHKALMLYLLCLPVRLRVPMLRFYYLNMAQ